MARKKLQHIHFTREGWYVLLMAAILFTGAMLRGINLLFLPAGLLLSAIVVSFFVVRRMLARVNLKYDLPPGVNAGEPTILPLTLSNEKRWRSSWLLRAEATIELRSPDDVENLVFGNAIPPLCPTVLFPRVPAKSQQNGVLVVEFAKRGIYTLLTTQLSSTFPFGLMRARRRIDETCEIAVFPKIESLNFFTFLREQEISSGEQQQIIATGNAGDFHGLRQYAEGDTIRQVDWRASARRAELYSRTYQKPTSPNVAVLLDLHLPDAVLDRQEGLTDDQQRRQLEQRIEETVSIAASLLYAATQYDVANLVAGCLIGKRVSITNSAEASDFLDEVLRDLAEVMPAREDHFPALLSTLQQHLKPTTELIIVTSDDEDSPRFTPLTLINASVRIIGGMPSK